MEPLKGKRVLLTGGSGFIGTNLVDFLRACGADVVSVDNRPPLRPEHRTIWRHCDLSVQDDVRDVTTSVDPHIILHLAARTDTDSSAVDDYAINWIGTRHTVEAAMNMSNAERYVLFSTQFVLGPGEPFRSETDYAPHTAYGESKTRAEDLVRQAAPTACWTIVRPTNIWGPWHLRYQREFWRVLSRGRYLHPSAPDPIRSYGYVGSICLQILAVLLAPETDVHGQTLYVGDTPIRLSTWVDEFSRALRGRPARRVPATAIRTLAKLGDVAQVLGWRTPIHTSRFKSMTEDYPTPMDRTEQILGRLPSVDLRQGVEETVHWLNDGTAADPWAWLRVYLTPQA